MSEVVLYIIKDRALFELTVLVVHVMLRVDVAGHVVGGILGLLHYVGEFNIGGEAVAGDTIEMVEPG